MFNAYTIGVTLTLTNRVSQGLLSLSGQFGGLSGNAAGLQRRLTALGNTARAATAQMVGAFAIASPIIYAIDKAAQLQKEMLGIQLATRGTTAEMDKMRRTIIGTAGQTIFSSLDVAKMGKLVATGTGFDTSQINALLPIFAKFADVQTAMKGTPYEESVMDLVRMAHQANAWTPEAISSYADKITKLSFVVPGGIHEIASSLNYSQAVLKDTLGMQDDTLLPLVAFVNRLGMAGTRGGTALTATLTRSISGIFGSGLLKGKSNEALNAMGMSDSKGKALVFDKEGRFDAMKFIFMLGTYVQKEFARHPPAQARQDVMTNFQHAFGTQGSRLASLFTTPQALEQLKVVLNQLEKGADTSVIQKKFFDESVWQQWKDTQTNFTSAMIELGWTVLPVALKGLKTLNSGLEWMGNYIHDHQGQAKLFAEAMMALAAGMAFTASVNALRFAFGGLSLAMNLLVGSRILKVGAAIGQAGLAGALIKLGGALGAVTGAGSLALGIAAVAGSLGTLAVVVGSLLYLFDSDARKFVNEKIGAPEGFSPIEQMSKNPVTIAPNDAVTKDIQQRGYVGSFGHLLSTFWKSATSGSPVAIHRDPSWTPWQGSSQSSPLVPPQLSVAPPPRRSIVPPVPSRAASKAPEGWTEGDRERWVQLNTQIELDGRQIAEVVTEHQAKKVSGPTQYLGKFDSRQSYTAPGQ